MKKYLTTLIFFIGCQLAYTQILTREDFSGLIPYLKTEDWKSAFKQSAKLLKSAPADTSDYHAMILYINIFSAAGMVSEGKMSFKELEEKVMKFKGQKIIMPSHPVTRKDGALSQVKFTVNDSTNEAFTSAANAKGVNIFCFERYYLKNRIDPADFPDRVFVRCGGILEKIETNPNKSTIWILRLTITNAFARKTS